MIGDTYKAKNSTESNVTFNDAAIIRKYDLRGKMNTKMIKMIIVMHPSFSTESEFKMAAISRMTGSVAQMVQNKTTCSACHEAVGSRQHKSEQLF